MVVIDACERVTLTRVTLDLSKPMRSALVLVLAIALPAAAALQSPHPLRAVWPMRATRIDRSMMMFPILLTTRAQSCSAITAHQIQIRFAPVLSLVPRSCVTCTSAVVSGSEVCACGRGEERQRGTRQSPDRDLSNQISVCNCDLSILLWYCVHAGVPCTCTGHGHGHGTHHSRYSERARTKLRFSRSTSLKSGFSAS
jgi:hypothetical protein